MNEFPVRNKAELSLIQKITFITAIADKKIIGVFSVSRGIVLRSRSRTAATSKMEHFMTIVNIYLKNGFVGQYFALIYIVKK